MPVQYMINPGIERVQALADVSRLALCCHSNETRAPIANPPSSAQLGGIPTIPPTYIRVHAVVCKCGKGQTHRQLCQLYILHLLRFTRHVTMVELTDDLHRLVL